MKKILLLNCLLLITVSIQYIKAQENLIKDSGFENATLAELIPTTPDIDNWRGTALADKDWKFKTSGGNPGNFAIATKTYTDLSEPLNPSPRNYIASNRITLEAGKSYLISVDHKTGSTTIPNIRVSYGTTQDNLNITETLIDEQTVTNTWTTTFKEFSVTTTGNYYVIIQSVYSSDATTTKLGVDNVSVTEVIPGATSVTTTAGWSTPASISSLSNSEVEAETVMKFTVTDDAASSQPTMFDAIGFNLGSAKSGFGDVYKNIGGLKLIDADDPTKSVAVNKTSTGLVFENLSTTIGELGHIADGASKNYELKMWFPELTTLAERQNAASQVVDFAVGQFSIISGSDAFAPAAAIEAGGIPVVTTATQVHIPYCKEIFAGKDFKLEVWATNEGFVLDPVATPTADIAVTLEQVGGNGILSSTTGLTQYFTINTGKCIWTDLQYSLENDPFQIKVTTTIYGDQLTYTSDVITAALAKDFIVGWNFTDGDNIADFGIAENAAVTIASTGLGNSDQYNKGGNDLEASSAIGFRNWGGLVADIDQYFEFSFSTLGYENLALSSTQRGASGNAPKDLKIQYKVGSGGSYQDLTGNSIEIDYLYWGASQIKGLALPSECDNQTEISIRYIQTTDNSIITDIAISDGMIHADDIYVVGTGIATSLKEPQTQSFNIYPNPVKNTLYLKEGSALYYQIYSANGSMIKAGNLKGNAIDVCHMAKGVYFIRITSDTGETFTKQFVK